MKNKKTKLFITASLFAALIFIFTALAPKIPTPSGYYHIGDTFIYLCASLIPFPFCVLSAAIGASLADLFAGYVVYLPFTFFIKAFMAMCFSAKSEKLLSKKNVLALVFASVINVAGYYISEVIILIAGAKAVNTASFITPLYSVWYNVCQSLVSAILFVIIAAAFDRTKIKSKIIF